MISEDDDTPSYDYRYVDEGTFRVHNLNCPPIWQSMQHNAIEHEISAAEADAHAAPMHFHVGMVIPVQRTHRCSKTFIRTTLVPH